MSDEYPKCLCGHSYDRHGGDDYPQIGCVVSRCRCDAYVAAGNADPPQDDPC